MADIDRVIKTVFDELDPIQMAIFRRMTPDEKGRAVADLFESMSAMVYATERERNPHLSEKAIHQRAIARLMRASEWDSWIQNILDL